MVAEREGRKESTLQVRMGADLKRDGEQLYRRLGTSLPEAVRIFVQQSLSVGGLPFDVRFTVIRPTRSRVQKKSVTGIGDELSLSLAALPEKYATGNWNGYDEKPLNKDSHRSALAFAENLPKAFRTADVGIDADGEVTFEWYKAKDNQCSLTFAESGNVYCIVRKNGDKLSANIASKSVGKILDLIGEVVNG